MKKITQFILLSSLLCWISACSTSKNSNSGQGGTDTNASGEVREGTTEASDTIENAGDRTTQKVNEAKKEWQQERDEFTTSAREKLRDFDQRIEKLNARIDQAGDKAKVDLKEDMANLKAKRNELNQQLNRLGDTSENAWDDVKRGASSAWDDIEKTFDRAKDKFDKSNN